jgi:hypothetical protein
VNVRPDQLEVCDGLGAVPNPPEPTTKVGIAQSVRGGLVIHGLRHEPVGDTCGWYLWADELSADEDFFKPLHMEHVSEWCPSVLKFLALPPGWRFLVATDYEDVWFDPSLIGEAGRPE